MSEPYIPANFKAAVDHEISRLTNELEVLRKLYDNAEVMEPVYQAATECFSYAALEWMNRPQRALGGKTCIEMALEGHPDAVIQIINAINYGVYL